MIGPLAVPQWNWRQFFACFGVWSEMKLPLSPLLLQDNSSTLSTMVSWQSRLQNWALKQDIFSTSSFASRLNVPCSLAHYFSGTIHHKIPRISKVYEFNELGINSSSGQIVTTNFRALSLVKNFHQYPTTSCQHLTHGCHSPSDVGKDLQGWLSHISVGLGGSIWSSTMLNNTKI